MLNSAERKKVLMTGIGSFRSSELTYLDHSLSVVVCLSVHSSFRLYTRQGR